MSEGKKQNISVRDFGKVLVYGTAALAGTAGVYRNQLIKGNIEGDVGLLPANLAVRKKIESEQPDTPENWEIVATAFLKSVDDYYGDTISEHDRKSVELWLAEPDSHPVNTGAHKLLVHSSFYHSQRQNEKTSFKDYVNDRYFPMMFDTAKRLDLSLFTLIGFMQRAAGNTTGVGSQNNDIDQEKLRLMFGSVLGASRQAGLETLPSFVKARRYEGMAQYGQFVMGPYLGHFINPFPTIGMQDLEMSPIATSINVLAKMDATALDDLQYRYPGAIDSLKKINKTVGNMDQARNLLRQRIDAYISNLDKDSFLIKLFEPDNIDSWEKIGLGRNTSQAGQDFLITHTNDIWANYCVLKHQNPEATPQDAINFTRNQIIELASKSGVNVAIEQIFKNLIESPKFRKVLKRDENAQKVLQIYDIFDREGSFKLDDCSGAFYQLSQLEYDDYFQIVINLSTMKAYTQQIEKYPELRILSESSKLWEILFSISIRDGSPPTALANNPNWPRTVYDEPYSPDAILTAYVGLISDIRHKYPGISNSDLFKTVITALEAKSTEFLESAKLLDAGMHSAVFPLATHQVSFLSETCKVSV